MSGREFKVGCVRVQKPGDGEWRMVDAAVVTVLLMVLAACAVWDWASGGSDGGEEYGNGDEW